VLIEFGEPIRIDDEWIRRFETDERDAVRQLTEHLADSLTAVTLNAPDWSTLRFVQAARRLYKPATANLAPSEFVELNRRFMEAYLNTADNPEIVQLRNKVDDYQTRLDALGLKDYQLRKKISVVKAARRIMLRSMTMLLLLPMAIPGVLLHLPAGWLAAYVGERFSYEEDDIATLKVFAALTLLPLVYLIVAFLIGSYFGAFWAVVVVVGLTISFSASVWIIEAQATLLVSMVSILRRTRLRTEIENLQSIRAELVESIRSLVESNYDLEAPRMFSEKDFSATGVIESDE
jgi:glycerol-3-phosphate O-acyltransferase/dihydroxyacetone phosphate acyltransferase